MPSTKLCILMLTVLMLIRGMSHTNYKQQLSGIFNVTSTARRQLSSCHQCLVTFFGIRNIFLLEASNAYRLYYVSGRLYGLIRAFTTHCNSEYTCLISTTLTKEYTRNVQSRSNSEQLTTKDTLHGLDEALYHLAKRMLFAKDGVNSAGWTTAPKDWRYENPALVHRQLLKIPLFFFGEYPRRNNKQDVDSVPEQERRAPSISVQAPLVSSDVINGNILSTQKGQNDGSTLKCMIIHTFLEEAVCRECLAMHSTSLTVRVYLLYHTSMIHSAELCVFRSIYEVSRIIESCKSFFCSEIVHWDTSDCDRMDNIFPKHSQIYMETNEKHNKRKRTHKTSGLDENVKNLKELGHVLTHIAYKRMARYAERRNGLMNVFQSSSTLKILQQESHACIILTSTRNHNTRCIGCILKNVIGARLVIISSFIDAMILTDASAQLPDCRHLCSHRERLETAECRKYLDEHTMNIEMHEKPSKPWSLHEYGRNCLVSYHTYNLKQACESLMRNLYTIASKEPKIHTITETSFLVYTSELGPMNIAVALSKYGEFTIEHSKRSRTCSRIQKVPLEFCFEHEAFDWTVSRQSAHPSAINMFTTKLIPVGIWPPKNYINSQIENREVSKTSCLLQHPFATDIQIWPKYNSIALVEYECVKAKHLNCVTCLLQHTEVFFAYNEKSGKKGYVWMSQAPSEIIGRCVNNGICSSLTCNYNRVQLNRPDGLRLLTHADFKVKRNRSS